MADQCIVCLEPLDVEPSTLAAPLGPAEEKPPPLQNAEEHNEHGEPLHERHAIEDADALARANQKNGPEHANHDNVAQIEACGHMLHDACLREWSEKANSCPICRQIFHVVKVYAKVGGELTSRNKSPPHPYFLLVLKDAIG
jgi:hypothetical protein